MAKTALIQRELKRDKLVAQYAKKYEELKSIANDAKKSDDERMAARLALQKLPRNANPTRQRNRCGRFGGKVQTVTQPVADGKNCATLAMRTNRGPLRTEVGLAGKGRAFMMTC